MIDLREAAEIAKLIPEGSLVTVTGRWLKQAVRELEANRQTRPCLDVPPEPSK